MTLWNLGSINTDYIYDVPHIPAPGETITSSGRQVFLGGKGTNISVAAARAGTHVCHIGAVGADGRWAVDRLMEYGVDTRYISQVETETCQAMIFVDPVGENTIVLHPGANMAIPPDALEQALTRARTDDWLVMQNETCLQTEAAELGKATGLRVAYAAAPFEADRVTAVLDSLDFLILNALEAEQLEQAIGQSPGALPVEHVIVTKGDDGATWFGPEGPVHISALTVKPVDTTGAGDTFTGYVLSGLARGVPMRQAMDQASRAAALMVTRHGTADVIPDLAEVQAFRG